MDQNLNPVLSQASVDPWQSTRVTLHQTTYQEPMKEASQKGPLVTLNATMEERFVNTLISRDGQPDIVPLTTNLRLKYKRRMLYFQMDFGELTLDGLLDIRAISSAIPEADLGKNRLLAPQPITEEGQAPNFQILVANGQLELQGALLN